jgi:IS30 family transposase
MDKLNNRPRKCLGSKTPNQLFSEINPPVALTSSIRAPKDLKSSE